MAMITRSAADAAVASAARRAAVGGAPGSERARLERELRTLIPGATDISATVEVTRSAATAAAVIEWTPPGPQFTSVAIRSTAVIARATPP